MNSTDVTTLSQGLNGTLDRLTRNSFIQPSFFDAYNIYLYVMIAFGLLGNFIVLAVFLKHPPKSTTDWFILCITSCDFMTSLVNTPVYVTFTNGVWRFYGTTVICTLHMFISQSVVLSSSFLIAGLSLDRYLKVCRQMSTFTKAKARNSCFAIFILTMLLSTPCFVMFENRHGQCVSIVMDRDLFAYYMMVFLIFVLATCVVVFSYYKVTRTVSKSEANVLRHAGRESLGLLNCCFRKHNKVAPSTTHVSDSGLFKDTVVQTTDNGQVEQSNSMRQTANTDLLSVPEKSLGLKQGSKWNLKTSLFDNQIYEKGNEHCASSAHAPTASNIERPSTSQNDLQVSRKIIKRSSNRITKMSFLVCSVFIITWIPPWISFILVTVPGMSRNVKVVKFMIFGRMTYLINTVTNPVVYTWLNKKFRKNIVEIFCCKSTRS